MSCVDTEELLARFDKGDTLAASRLMSVVERGGADAERVLDTLYPRTGKAVRIGITGGTGSGKSTLIDALTPLIRTEHGRTLGIVAQDPTSPFSGGAVLGDRIRMNNAVGDAGVFVRSIASRGGQTGFSDVAVELADVLDAFGREVIIMETIGVGQLEHRIRYNADTTVVVLTPESGDEVQSLKAGLMEIGDVFVVNKSDRPGAERFTADIIAALEIRESNDGWEPPVIVTVASEGKGAHEVLDAVHQHLDHLGAEGRREKRRAEGLRDRVRVLAEGRVGASLWGNPYFASQFDAIFQDVLNGAATPYEAAARLAGHVRIDQEGGS